MSVTFNPFRRQPVATRPALRPAVRLTPRNAPPLSGGDDYALTVSKALGQVEFICRSYGKPYWDAGELAQRDRHQWRHDLEVMLRHGSLQGVTLEVLDRQQQVLAKFQFSFRRSGGRVVVDGAQGIELPVLPLARVAGRRLTITRSSDRSYEHLLLGSWSSAAALTARAMDSFDSAHAAKTSGSRIAATFGVDKTARRTLVIQRVSSRGFAFAAEVQGGNTDVFVHPSCAPCGTRFVIGQRFTALLVQTPRGLQAREARPV